tara:strand:+ start:608 stop:907 length:300 start_codon:yes stop_codon:yes gene_type:complete
MHKIIYGIILLVMLSGCKTMQSSVINLKEPIGNGWVFERKDFKASERNSYDEIDKRLRALDKESKKYKDPMETTIHFNRPLSPNQYWEREEFLRHFDRN